MALAYYNENDPFATAWLRRLIDEGLIARGDVDERSIAEVRPGDLDGYTQCHFFAGIGGWSYALRLAGWSDSRPCWTGSCPCQPFSAAGKGEGFQDPRHLWPRWFRLVCFRRPGVVFSEQVGKALQWLDLVSGDMEGEGYTIGSAIVGAHSVGAPHRRQRIYWVADSPVPRRPRTRQYNGGLPLVPARPAEYGVVGHSHQPGPQGRHVGGNGSSELAAGEGGVAGGMGDTECPVTDLGRIAVESGKGNGASYSGPPVEPGRSGHTGYWNPCEWIWCRDSKYRPVEPGTFPLAHGISKRVGRLRGYGNAIVPQVAAEFIGAYMEIIDAC